MNRWSTTPLPNRPASSQSLKAGGDGFTHLQCDGKRPGLCPVNRLKPNNTDIWCEAILPLLCWSLSSSKRDWNSQNSLVVSLITWTGLWLILNLNESIQNCCDILTEEVKRTYYSLFSSLGRVRGNLELQPSEPAEKSKRIPEIHLIIYLHMIILKILKEKCLFLF